jgi:hypothetical protein
MMPSLSRRLFRHTCTAPNAVRRKCCELQSSEAISHKMECLPTAPEIASSWRPGAIPRNDDKFLEGDFHGHC